MKRFESFSRGAFERTSLRPHPRRWGRGHRKVAWWVPLVLVLIGGGLYYAGRSISWSFVDDWGGRLASQDHFWGGLVEVATATGGGSVGESSGVHDAAIGGESGEVRGGGVEASEAGEAVAVGEEAKEESEEVQRLRAYLVERGSPLGDFVEEIYQEEKRAGIFGLSRLVVAIAGAESRWGVLSLYHNAWGIKCGSDYYCRYLSWPEGIQAIAKVLGGATYNLGGEVTEDEIRRIAPIYAESPRWPDSVTYFWRELEN